jgi:hypothetical protein
MRLTGYILAFYLLLLSAIPCCAFDDCPDDKPVQSSQHERGDSDCGNCSPFFSCEGCATATANDEPIRYEIVALQALPVFTGYLHSSLTQVHFDFWQPPRLG